MTMAKIASKYDCEIIFGRGVKFAPKMSKPCYFEAKCAKYRVA